MEMHFPRHGFNPSVEQVPMQAATLDGTPHGRNGQTKAKVAGCATVRCTLIQELGGVARCGTAMI